MDLSHQGFEIVGEHQFFAPVASDVIDGLVGKYEQRRKQIEQVGALFDGDLGGVVHYFIEGNRKHDNSRYGALSAEKIFEPSGAIAALNASFWQQAMNLTDVYDAMPQKRRDEWNTAIRDMTTPDFEEDAVRATLQDLLHSRAKFLAERVDGIFRALSDVHLTNAPQGFGRRMILNYVYTSYGTTNSTQVGHINDLRCIIAKFMGRDEPKWNASENVVKAARHRSGEWMTVDGGAMRIRVYKKGTAHLEIHPEMAWRLNSILAHLHPLAIPAEFRTAPKRKPKAFATMQRPLPFAVLDVLAGVHEHRERYEKGFQTYYHPIARTRELAYGSDNKVAREEAIRVLEAIGGVRTPYGKAGVYWTFDYEPGNVLDEIVASGCIPDQKSHQFYPTPAGLAAELVELADIGPDDTVLEPSAGMGGLADLLPKDRTTCVEISKLHCDVLKAKGHAAEYADFLIWALSHRACYTFDRVVMNPPFSEGRAKDHTLAAASLVAPGGKLVAILPAGMKGKDLLGAGWTETWGPARSNQFPGVSIDVVLYEAQRS